MAPSAAVLSFLMVMLTYVSLNCGQTVNLSPSLLVVERGSDAELICSVTGVPTPLFLWYDVRVEPAVLISFNGQPSASADYSDYDITVNGASSTMTISLTVIDNEGDYACQEQSSALSSSSCTIYVEVKSTLSEMAITPALEDGSDLIAGDSYNVQCGAVGARPQELFQLYINNVEAQTNNKIETFQVNSGDPDLTDTTTVFTITPTSNNNGQDMFCQTTGHQLNSLNQDSDSMTLSVRYPPPSSGIMTVDLTQGENLMIACNVDVNEANPVISSFYIYENGTLIASASSHQKPTPDMETTYLCVAGNYLGNTSAVGVYSPYSDINCTCLSSAAAVGIGVLTFLLALSITLNLIQFIMRRRCPQGIKNEGTNSYEERHTRISNMSDHCGKVVTENEPYESVGMESKAYQPLNVINKDLDSLDIAGDSLSFFTRLGSIGLGAYGDVWKGEIRSKEGAHVVALRQLPETFTKLTSFIHKMRDFHDLPNHQNVVKCLGFCPSRGTIIWEFVGGGTLLTYLQQSGPQYQPTYGNVKQTRRGVDESKLLKFGWQIAKGMDFLASKKIVHGNLCAHNVLLTDDRRCKISDYGRASLKSATDTKPSRWTPPEAMLNGASSVGGDIWSFGIVLWEIITLGARPYPNMTFDVVKHEVRDGYRMQRPRHCGKDLYAIMEGCWEMDPMSRCHFSDILRSLERIMEGDHEYLSLNNLDEGLYTSPLEIDI